MCTSQAIRDDVLPGELSAQVEHTGWEARQRQDMPRLEESIIQAEDVFANPGPAAVNPVGRAEKTLLQASLEEKEHRDGGEPPPLSPTCRHRR